MTETREWLTGVRWFAIAAAVGAWSFVLAQALGVAVPGYASAATSSAAAFAGESAPVENRHRAATSARRADRGVVRPDRSERVRTRQARTAPSSATGRKVGGPGSAAPELRPTPTPSPEAPPGQPSPPPPAPAGDATAALADPEQQAPGSPGPPPPVEPLPPLPLPPPPEPPEPPLLPELPLVPPPPTALPDVPLPGLP